MIVKQEIISYRLITKLNQQELSVSEQEKKYRQALELKKQEKYDQAQKMFESLRGYKDSNAQMVRCMDAKKEISYNQAIKFQNMGEYYKAKCLFESVHPYKSSDVFLKTCEIKLLEKSRDFDYQEAKGLMQNKQYDRAQKIFETLRGYKDSNAQMVRCMDAKKEISYNEAINLKNKGEYYRAKGLFESILPYKDSNTQMALCDSEVLLERIKINKLYQESVKYLTRNEFYNKGKNNYSGQEDLIVKPYFQHKMGYFCIQQSCYLKEKIIIDSGRRKEIEFGEKLAFEWFSISAKNGFNYAKIALSYCFAKGRGTNVNECDAKLLEKEIDEFSIYMYATFSSTMTTKEERIYWLEKLLMKEKIMVYSDEKSTLLNLDFKTLWKDGNGDVIQIFKSALAGNPEAWYCLGFCYRDGKDVKYDPVKKKNMFEKAANLGHAGAMCYIAWIYYNGLAGIEKNTEKALAWYKKAADLGDEEAKKKIKAIEKAKNGSKLAKWFAGL